jgi:drug/metabolite transporter (DMT)-like permease
MRYPTPVVAFLAVGLIAASQSGNIIRLADAHPVVIVGWRLVFATALSGAVAGRRLGELGRLTWSERGLLVLAGLALTGHFVLWTAAIQHTTVANTMVFFNINPVFTATAAYLVFGERAGWRLWLAIGLGLAGVVTIGLGDLAFDPDHLLGDALAVGCSLLFTAYFLLGKRLRPRLDNRAYTTALYAVAGAAALLLVPVRSQPLLGYDGVTWLSFVLLALGPTMLGHTSMNLALRYIPAGTISVLTLSEPFFAALVAYWAWHEGVSLQTAAGFVLIAGSVVAVVWDARSGSGTLNADRHRRKRDA